MSYTSQAQGGNVGELRRFRVSDRRTARAHRVKASATGPEMEVLLMVTVGVRAPECHELARRKLDHRAGAVRDPEIAVPVERECLRSVGSLLNVTAGVGIPLLPSWLLANSTTMLELAFATHRLPPPSRADVTCPGK